MPIKSQFNTEADFLSALRDWFAGQALSWAGHDNWTSSNPEALARRAYQMADAMLAARVQK